MDKKPEVKVVYKKLRERLDKYPVGAPESPELYRILETLFSEEHARIASLMPMKPTSLEKLAARTGVPEDRLRGMFEEMAGRGIIIDFHHAKSGKSYYMLAPTVVGFFEFSLMKERDDFDQKRVADNMHTYFFQSDRFAKEVFQGRTQIGRTLVHETALDEDALSNVLDTERASRMLETCGAIALSHCYCRHKSRLTGHQCEKPEEICLALGPGSEYLTRNKLARPIQVPEALDLLELARESGLVQIADNILKGPTFICNCCGCCCGMLTAINGKGLTYAVHTSNFIAAAYDEDCKGCGKCVERCPINAISMREETRDDGKRIKKAVVDEKICLGCGVCLRACNFDALAMKRRAKRTLTPETTLERILLMAIERGKLQHFLFDDIEGPTGEFLKSLTGAFLNLPLSKRLLLNREVQSRFLDFINKRAPSV